MKIRPVVSFRLFVPTALVALVSCPGVLWAQLPASWSDFDIGFPSQPGSASFDGVTWTVSGGGDDIWNDSDNFHFAFEGASDDAVITARVTAVQSTDSWAKAGVMFRDS